MSSFNRIGIAITTFSEEKTNSKRYDIIKESLESLISSINNSALELHLFLVVDGDVPTAHNKIIDSLKGKVNIIRRHENGGISKAKNTCIKSILDAKCDLGFLADDDVLFKNGNDIREFEKLKINAPNSNSLKTFRKVSINGFKLFKHNGASGVLLSFTPKLIDTIGYFKVMPGKIGSEHIHFTRRANKAKLIGQPVDFEDSWKLIEHIGMIKDSKSEKVHVIHSVTDEFRKKECINNSLAFKDLEKYVEFED